MSNETQTSQHRKRSEAEIIAEDERRIEIRYLKHLKRKYPAEDRRISEELRRGDRG